MLVFQLFAWWYGAGWSQLQNKARKQVGRTAQAFSLKILLKTMFSPWRRIVTTPGAGLEAHVRAATDNFVSRCVGFSVRVLVLFAALVILFLVSFVSITEVILWPLIPLGIAGCVIKGALG